MRLFKCQTCGQLLYFENTKCERCSHVLGYEPGQATLLSLEPGDETDSGQLWTSGSTSWRFCENARHQVCNWLIDAASPDRFCTACRHNHVIPDLAADPENLLRWRALEYAKHRLFYTLLKLRLPLATRTEDPVHGLAFDFLADTPAQPRVLTGHDNGLITIALKEGDHAERERMREQMGELYRTPLGHFRHEVGHHYWDLLVRDTDKLEAFRAMFGDEREDYESALKAHYARTPKPGWQQYFVSLYATSHPWEDFAETWAHYLHIVDTLEMAGSFGVGVHPKLSREPGAAGRHRLRSAQATGLCRHHRRLAAAGLCGEQPEPLDGPERSLPVRAVPKSGGEAGLHPRVGTVGSFQLPVLRVPRLGTGNCKPAGHGQALCRPI